MTQDLSDSESSVIQNPILRGFNPDPSIIRVGADYYIATSTFEWFPGVQIHHSRDLQNWNLIARPLDSVTKLDMQGTPDSCGVWAPCLSYSDGLFYLVYSNVKSFDGRWKDTPNYLVTATDILGPWSDPIYLSSVGFDGSLFHDNDGRKWYSSMIVDHRADSFFGGIVLREYSAEKEQLVGPEHLVTRGTGIGLTEGPHYYQRDGYYYLLLAEGGTEYGHAASIMRSRSVTGPYESYESNPILSSRDNKQLELQKSGHASLVESESGDWYIVFLVGRPLAPHGRCILGRETAIEELDWVEGWPVLKAGGNNPRTQIPGPRGVVPVARAEQGVEHVAPRDNQVERVACITSVRDDFDDDSLNIHFQSLRVPIDKSWCSLSERKGFLRLTGRESLASLHSQSLVARRVQHFNLEVETCVEFDPSRFQEMAGLVFYYNTGHYHYLHITADEVQNLAETGGKVVRVLSSDNYAMTTHSDSVDVSDCDSVYLKAVLDREVLQFFVSRDGIDYQPVGDQLDASILSDDYVREGSDRYRPAFTGCFVGLCCQDLAYNSKSAYFDWFEYRAID